VKSERKQPTKIDFRIVPLGLNSKIVAWAMCEGWWTEARITDERSGMQARGTKQRELVEDTPRELPWIESGSLVRDFWSAVEYSGIPEFLGRLKARGHALMAK